jgi:hypothetical protein
MDKNFTKPSYIWIAEILNFGEINFHQCRKGRHILYMYVMINAGQNIYVIRYITQTVYKK